MVFIEVARVGYTCWLINEPFLKVTEPLLIGTIESHVHLYVSFIGIFLMFLLHNDFKEQMNNPCLHRADYCRSRESCHC
jgi:hypothetical protein